MEEKFEIFYIRHADTSGASQEGKSKCDIGLSALGEEQIKLLAERFAGARFDAVLSSPLVRAVRTAAAVAEKLEYPKEIEIVPELIENGSSKDYFGVDIDFLGNYFENIILCGDKICDFKDETDEDNDKRAAEIIAYLKKRFGFGKRILVFAHGSFGNHFIPAAVEMGKGNYILSINNTSVTKIKYTEDGKQRISFQNDFSHLRPLMPDYEFTV